MALSRCISSMKKTSLASRLVRIPARSPARSRTGPDVCFILTLSSLAIIIERVVLPSPGGPKKEHGQGIHHVYLLLQYIVLSYQLFLFDQ